jgi:hypothetical protein
VRDYRLLRISRENVQADAARMQARGQRMQARTIATITGGIVTQGLAILVWFLVWQQFQTDLLKFWVNLILPAGAMCLGAIGGAGFLFAGRWVKRPGTPGLKWLAALIAIAAAVIIRFLGYWSIEFGGIPLHSMMSFGDYLQATLGHARMDFSRMAHHTGTVELGQWGYLMEAIQSACYALGSFAFAAALPPAVRCKRGHGIMHEQLSGKLRIRAEALESFYHGLPADPAARMAALQVADPGSAIPAEGAVELLYRLVECQQCSGAAVAESGQVHNGKYWIPFKPLTRTGLFDRMSSSTPRPPVEPVSGPRTFGRRTAI